MRRFHALLPLALACAFASGTALAAPTLDIETVNSADATAQKSDKPDKSGKSEKSASPAILRLQVLLDRARFSPGQIDGFDGGNTRTALAGYKAAHGLGDGDSLDAETWTALTGAGGPALVEYTVTEQDVAGPFVDIPNGMMAQAKLDRLAYTSPTEALAEKFHANPALLKTLNPNVDITKPGTKIVVPNVHNLPALTSVSKVVVDDSDKTVSVFDSTNKKIAQFPATTGSSHDPLPIGEWKIKGVAKEPVFHYNPKLFWDADPSHSKAKIAPGPNNPVGLVWIDLSKEHYGLHGTPEPALIGKTQSHGCIRLTNWSAQTLAQAVSPGTPAILQE
ncbi:L,D-transpeptidase family protein [Cognatilysobacter bugurensis]|uniref:Peptidoglycan-binding protein n=1 Tax=Cognatilysobacter bugurensis TaxID=543356 RepID=A0A918W5F0_9GAMM|nr:L,D-transpeptidase family protein [Lysobacter bugurensis]GHA70559.1 peptidoglycan-binding protein [Lysobacter bugurensis]